MNKRQKLKESLRPLVTKIVKEMLHDNSRVVLNTKINGSSQPLTISYIDLGEDGDMIYTKLGNKRVDFNKVKKLITPQLLKKLEDKYGDLETLSDNAQDYNLA